jgi:hypothetical protein
MGETKMEYLQAVEWSEFVNQAASGGPPTAMQEHDGTCGQCYVETGALWQKLADAAEVEASYQPAPEIVRVVKATFATASVAARRNGTDVPMQLLYDSASQPAAAGTRSSAMPIRQLLYRADPYQIDLQIEFQKEQNRFLVTGQLVDVSHPELVGRDVQVILSDGREYIVNTVTNQFGEFRGEVKSSGDLEISFLGRSEKPLVILLRGPLDQMSGTKD